MAISGLIVTLAENAPASGALASLSANPLLTVGDRFGCRVAVVAETSGVEADRALFDEIRATPGVVNVDVAFVHLDHDNTGGHPIREGREETQHAHD